MKRLAFLALLAGMLSVQAAAQEKTIEVAPWKLACRGLAPMQCLQVRNLHTNSWQLLYAGIKGFRYEDGFAYTLLVREEQLAHPPADGSSISLSLVSILKKEKMHHNNPQAAMGSWQLSRLFIRGQLTTVPGQAWHLEIGDSTLSARLCNHMQGKLLMGPQGQWIAGPLARTKMMCPEMDWEDAFVQALANADSYQWKDTSLVILQHGDTLAEFTRKTIPSQTTPTDQDSAANRAWLAATSFRVQFIDDEQGKTDMRSAQATMRFDLNNQRVTGNGSCNRFFAEARFSFTTANSGGLVMGKAGSTLMACPQHMDLEQRFFRLLEQANGFSISGNTLRITRSGRVLMELLAD